MVAGFPRALSLPGSPIARSRSTDKSHHLRSTSLPTPSHPLISLLDDEIRACYPYSDRNPSSPPAIASGLDRIERVLSSLHDLLQLSQSQDSIRRSGRSAWTDRLLEDSLRLADAYGTLRSETIEMREQEIEAKAAIRRRDEPRLASSSRSLKRAEKELIRLACALREAARPIPPAPGSDSAEAELAEIAGEAMLVAVLATEAVLLGIVGVSSATAMMVTSPSVMRSLRKLSSISPAGATKKREMDVEEWRRIELERLEELERMMGEIESKTERLFKILVNVRVSLLNILTPCL